MALLAYNLTGAPVTLTTVTPAVVLPASGAPPALGEGVNVTSELRGLPAATYALLQTQSVNTVRYIWEDGVDYVTPGLIIWDDTRTSAALTYYVATTGDNANDGLTVGTPLLTIQAAIDRLPKKITHAVAIVVAAGTYVGDVIVGDFQLLVGTGSTSSAGGASITIQGPTTWTVATLGSGTASGTVTAYVAAVGATATLGTLTDSGQSWTVDALKGLFLLNVATGSRRAIVSNTATTVDIGSSLGTVTPGVTTYEIQKPAAIIQGTFNIVNNTGFANPSNCIIVQHVEVQSVSTTTPIASTFALMYVANTLISAATSVLLSQVRVVSTHLNLTALAVLNSTVQASNSYFGIETTGVVNALQVSGRQAFVTLNGAYIRAASAGSTGGAVSLISGAQFSTFLSNINVMEATGTSSAAVVSVVGSGPTTCRVPCGVFRGTASKVLLDIGPTSFSFSPTSFYLEGTRFETGSVGIKIGSSGVCRINSGFGIPSFSGVTTELQVDATTSTYAAFIALTPKKIVGDYGSMLVQY